MHLNGFTPLFTEHLLTGKGKFLLCYMLRSDTPKPPIHTPIFSILSKNPAVLIGLRICITYVAVLA